MWLKIHHIVNKNSRAYCHQTKFMCNVSFAMCFHFSMKKIRCF